MTAPSTPPFGGGPCYAIIHHTKMGEPFGIVAGAVGIAATFTTCVDCFNYIQVGRELDRDFQQHVATLKLLEMRLSRWGASVNVYNDPNLGNPSATSAEMHTAKMTLFQILGLFSESEKKSRPFQSSAPWDPAIDLQDPAMTALVTTVSSISLSRKRGAGLLQRTRWALHDRESLKHLTGGISDLMDSLEKLFPAKEAQQRLADEDIEKIAKSVTLELEDLQKLVDGFDNLLGGRVSNMHNSDIYEFIIAQDRVRTSQGTVIFTSDNENAGVGTSFGSHGRKHVFKIIKAKDDVRMHNGTMINKSVFDWETCVS